MPMTIVVTRNSPARIRGFLASCMCEIAPGVYTAPRMSAAVRGRVWTVLEEWFVPTGDHAILMTWPNPELRGGQDILTLGVPRQELWECDGVYLARTSTAPDQPAAGDGATEGQGAGAA